MTSVSEDYARGFQAGYADFLFYGGSGEPPAVPPRDYWRLDERAGVRKPCVTDWFSGFRHGVTVAGHQGYREMEEIPTELLLPFETDHYAESDGAWMDKVTDVSVWRGQTQNEMDEVVEPREAVAPEDVELIAPPEPDDGWRQRDARDLEP
ncbi:MAG: hypothetical protein KDA42_08990 [Planctomycetales bacterium]|nr:hypothetical protein [Planctomycetales bacterium]